MNGHVSYISVKNWSSKSAKSLVVVWMNKTTAEKIIIIVQNSLPKTTDLLSAKMFAECILSGTRKNKLSPSALKTH